VVLQPAPVAVAFQDLAQRAHVRVDRADADPIEFPPGLESRLFAACDAYLAAKRATANRERTVAFDEERLAIVKDRIGDVLLSTITREMIEGLRLLE
jgi:hypothetical protein